MRPTSIVRPRPVRGFHEEKVIYLPWDVPSGLIASFLEKHCQAKRDLEFCTLYNLKNRTVLFRALSAPLAALALEPLILSGAKDIVLLGFCGSLSRDFRIADVVSVKKAFADEGTSEHYIPRQGLFAASPALREELEIKLLSLGLGFKTGTIVSTDAPFRETRPWREKNQDRGAGVVDMETSAVFALAAFHKIRAASLQVVSDELFGKRWKKKFSGRELERKAKDYFLTFLSPEA